MFTDMCMGMYINMCINMYIDACMDISNHAQYHSTSRVQKRCADTRVSWSPARTGVQTGIAKGMQNICRHVSMYSLRTVYGQSASVFQGAGFGFQDLGFPPPNHCPSALLNTARKDGRTFAKPAPPSLQVCFRESFFILESSKQNLWSGLERAADLLQRGCFMAT